MDSITYTLLLKKSYTIPGALLVGAGMVALSQGNIKAFFLCTLGLFAWEAVAAYLCYRKEAEELQKLLDEAIEQDIKKNDP